MKPSFLIIGGVKCASSSLYRYLNEHPQILPCKTKEPGYLNNKNPLRLIAGYRDYIKLFPNLKQEEVVADWLEIGKDSKMEASTFSKQIEKGKKYITGEATATTYVFANPRIVKFLFPGIKVILSLRNPTQRFISHFNMFKRFEKEGKKGHQYGTLEDFIIKEIMAYQNGKQTKILHQGIYIKYLPKWKNTFGKYLKVIHSHSLNGKDAAQTLNDIILFFGLESFDFSSALNKKHNVNPSRQSFPKEEALLNEFYLPFNDKLLTQYQIVL